MKITIKYPHSTDTHELDIKSVYASDESVVILAHNSRVNQLELFGMVTFDNFVGIYPVFNPLPRIRQEMVNADFGYKIKIQNKYVEDEGWRMLDFVKIKPETVFDLLSEYSLYLNTLKSPNGFIVFNSKLPLTLNLNV